MPDLLFKFGTYKEMPGYWVEVESVDSFEVISGGHFNSKKEVFDFYIRSKRYFGDRMKGKVEI